MSKLLYLPRIRLNDAVQHMIDWTDKKNSALLVVDLDGMALLMDGLTIDQTMDCYEQLTGLEVDDCVRIYERHIQNVSRETFIQVKRYVLWSVKVINQYRKYYISGENIVWPMMEVRQAQMIEQALERKGMKLSVMYDAMRLSRKFGYTRGWTRSRSGESVVIQFPTSDQMEEKKIL